MGLVTEGCVKLGDEETPDSWSCDVACISDGGIDGAVDVDGGGFDGAEGIDCGCDDMCGEPGASDGATAAAAAAEYRIGGRVAGGRGAGRPALRILAIGCCTKFGFGGSLDTESTSYDRKNIQHY
jgi:hypothetical protein